MTRSARTTTQDVWCGARKGSLISPNPPTQFMTFVGFRVSLPPKPPYQGGLAWRWRPACWLGAVRAVSLRSRNFRPFLALLPFKEAYGKAGPLRETPYAKGRSLREGPVLTGGSLTGMIPFTKKDDEEAYGQAGPLQEAPYGEGRSLREGPVLTGGSLTGLVPFTKKERRRGLREGWALTGSPLRGKRVLTKSLTEESGCLTGRSRHREGRRKAYGKAEPLREAPYRQGPGCLTGPFTEKDEG